MRLSEKFDASIIIFISMVMMLFSCKTVRVNQTTQNTTKSIVELGTIGTETKKIEATIFETTAIPVYKNNIRVAVSVEPFNKNTFTAYTNAAKQQNKHVTITYIDSVANKPGYLSLKLIDKVQLINQLNASYNKQVNAYLQNASKTKIITAITAYVTSADLTNINLAEEAYLVNNKQQKYSLVLVKNNKTFTTIDISRIIPFSYTTASFCWKKEGSRVSIANIVEGNRACAKNTYKNVARLHKKINYFKY